MEKLQGKDLDQAVAHLPGWQVVDQKLVREYSFRDFRRAIEFVNDVAEQAEQAGHHPDIDIRYNKVKLSLETHDSGGVTVKDVHFAETLKQRNP